MLVFKVYLYLGSGVYSVVSLVLWGQILGIALHFTNLPKYR